MLRIAEMLVSRSRKVLSVDALCVEDAVHAAVLALEAKELLGCRTPTTALEALALQHEAEVTAESMFLGVDYTLDLGDRFREIKKEVKASALWFAKRYRKRSELNARLTIIERLAQRFRDLNQIEEELGCLSEARKLRFAFWVREKPWRWILWPLLRYLSFMLQSLPRFVGAVSFWGLFFGFGYYFFGRFSGRPDLEFWDAMVSSWKVFLTGEPVNRWIYLVHDNQRGGWEIFWNGWLTFQGLISFTNLGLLLSHLYLIVSRR